MSVSEQSTRQERRHQESPLKSERGSTTIQDGVVSKVAGVAAKEVDGVRMGGSTSQSANSLLGSITGGSSGGSASRGVSVEVGELEAAVDLAMTVEYGRSIHQREGRGATTDGPGPARRPGLRGVLRPLHRPTPRLRRPVVDCRRSPRLAGPRPGGESASVGTGHHRLRHPARRDRLQSVW